jgi:hypothetical protein
MSPLIHYIIESVNQSFDNWKTPNKNQLRLEFKIEHELKGNSFFKDEDDFMDRVSQADVVEITPRDDDRIYYRSQTTSKKELLSLISGYRSYPEFRNEKTVDDIYKGFGNNLPMDYPIVLEFKNGKRRVFSGNTRMDVAFQMNINPKVLLIKLDI